MVLSRFSGIDKILPKLATISRAETTQHNFLSPPQLLLIVVSRNPINPGFISALQRAKLRLINLPHKNQGNSPVNSKKSPQPPETPSSILHRERYARPSESCRATFARRYT